MSKFYIDTEFIEGFHKPLFGKRRHFIDLISIGIVCENGAEYSAISSEYNYKDASDWVKENVIERLYIATVDGFRRQFSFESNFHKHYGKPNKQIAEEIKQFVWKHSGIHNPYSMNWEDVKHQFPVSFNAYYADYDWVLLCSLFGTMMDLPLGFPMYCIDLKQTLDENTNILFDINTAGMAKLHRESIGHERTLAYIQVNDRDYPKQGIEHSAIYDARWNRALDIYLKSHK